MKKLTLVMASFGLVMFAACGDDSSSNSSSTDKDAQGRTIYHSMIDAMEAPCSEANQCEEIIMDDPIAQDTLICLGTMFQSKIGRDLSKCGVTSADDPATDISPVVPATDTQAEVTPTDVPATDTPAASASGDVVTCLMDITMSLGGGMDLTTKSCAEATAGSDYAATLTAACVDVSMPEMGMVQKVTAGTACPEGYKLKCPLADHVVYQYDDDANCADAK